MASFLAALKAIPEVVMMLREISSELKKYRLLRTDRVFNEIKEEINVLTRQVKDETDRNKLLDIVKRINNTRL